MRWQNQHKAPFWRLVNDAHPTPARMASADIPCVCGGGVRAAAADRVHCFWDCPVAQAVRAELERAAASEGRPSTSSLVRAQVWLAQPPPGMHQGVWDVVCLAFVEAVSRARARATAAMLREQSPCVPGDLLVATARRVAVARFWGLLGNFAELGAPRSWLTGADAALLLAHPFLALRAPASHALVVAGLLA